MKRMVFAAVAIVGACVLSAGANATYTYVHGQNMQSAHMLTLGTDTPPIGHIEFCRRKPSECAPHGLRPMAVRLTKERAAELRAINDHVNTTVMPVTDLELHGVVEHWGYPVNNMGDCEDYALLKRKMLMEKGWPESALLMTVVRDEKGEGHAVLTVVTDQGDLILDNQRKSILSWHETGYYFIKRQSAHHPATWVSLRDLRYALTGSSTGAQ